MPKGINKVVLLGNVGQDPEIRFTPSGVAVANMSLATTEKWKDRQSGQMQEKTEWHRLVLWKGLAEIAQKYVTKGSRLYVEGKLQTRKWQAADGTDRYATEIVVSDMSLEGGGRQQGTNGAAHGAHQAPPSNPTPPHPNAPQRPAPTQHGGQNTTTAAPQGYGAPNPQSFDDFDDEIPF